MGSGRLVPIRAWARRPHLGRAARLLAQLWAVALLGAVPAAAAAAEKIQPGMLVRTPDSTGGCTANFIYDGLGPIAGRTFIGIASHCFGDLEETRSVDRDGVLFGHLVLKNWPLASVREDYALIEIVPGRLKDVDPSMKGHPAYPTGVAGIADVNPGDAVQISGWGSFMYLHDDLREKRQGVVNAWDGTFYEMVAPILFGDSGGGLVHIASGKALGIVSAYCTPTNFSPERQPVGCTVYGPSVAEVELGAAERGFPIRMRRAGEPPPPPPQPSGPAQGGSAGSNATPPGSRKPAAKRKKKQAAKKCRKGRKNRKSRRCRARRQRR